MGIASVRHDRRRLRILWPAVYKVVPLSGEREPFTHPYCHASNAAPRHSYEPCAAQRPVGTRLDLPIRTRREKPKPMYVGSPPEKPVTIPAWFAPIPGERVVCPADH